MTRHRTKIMREGPWYKLIKSINPKTKRTHYIVQVNPYKLPDRNITKVRDHFDPHHSRGCKFGTKWKFGNREVAEKLITIALLKFGSG